MSSLAGSYTPTATATLPYLGVCGALECCSALLLRIRRDDDEFVVSSFSYIRAFVRFDYFERRKEGGRVERGERA